jgi:hypothetical protein
MTEKMLEKLVVDCSKLDDACLRAVIRHLLDRLYVAQWQYFNEMEAAEKRLDEQTSIFKAIKENIEQEIFIRNILKLCRTGL